MKLVSAIMPTRGRKEWAAQGVACFLSQTYPHKELLILDDEEDPSFPEPPQKSMKARIEIEYLPIRQTIAQKRNRLAVASYGDILFTLDDDDWSAPERMEQQVKLLEESGKAITGYSSMLFHDGEQAYRYKAPPRHALGTSLCYLRSWALDNPFQNREGVVDDISRQYIASDNDLVSRAYQQGQLVLVDGGAMMVARMHPNNTSSSKWIHRHQSPSYRPVSLDQLPEGFLRPVLA